MSGGMITPPSACCIHNGFPAGTPSHPGVSLWSVTSNVAPAAMGPGGRMIAWAAATDAIRSAKTVVVIRMVLLRQGAASLVPPSLRFSASPAGPSLPAILMPITDQ